MESLLELVRAEKQRAGKMPLSPREEPRDASPLIPIKDIHSAAAKARELEDQLLHAIALYRKQRARKQVGFLTLPPRRVPTIITSFHDLPTSPVVTNPPGAYHARPKGSPLLRQRVDREITCWLDSREQSTDFQLRHQFSVGCMEPQQITQMDSEYIPRPDQDVNAAAAKAEKVCRQFDLLVEKFQQLQAENRQLRQMVTEAPTPPPVADDRAEQSAADAARIKELEQQVEELEERCHQLQQRNGELEEALASLPETGTELGSARVTSMPEIIKPTLCERSLSPITRETTSGLSLESQLQAVRFEHEQRETAWMAERQELLERLDDLTRRLEEPQVSLPPGKTNSMRRTGLARLVTEEALMRSAIEKDQCRGLKVLQHLSEVNQRRASRLAQVSGRVRSAVTLQRCSRHSSPSLNLVQPPPPYPNSGRGTGSASSGSSRGHISPNHAPRPGSMQMPVRSPRPKPRLSITRPLSMTIHVPHAPPANGSHSSLCSSSFLHGRRPPSPMHDLLD
eukprot:GGOE01004214.1.p1 GENE.GGOE01004214.1~~GGOE01004214.1.p1  ORF type:complete len:563 (+),score=159.41 GGOE01004214.1:158-1690(+)